MRVTGGLRGLAAATAAGVAVAVVLSLLAGPAVARPRNPSDREITAAAQERSRKAAEVGRLVGLVARANGDARRAMDRAELAVERYNKAVVDLHRAAARAARARAAVAAAQRAVGVARRDFGDFARGSYMQGSTLGSASVLLDSRGPTELLQRADLLVYAGRRHLDALGRLDRATVRRANAQSVARLALARQRVATTRAERAKIAAAREMAEARARLVALRARRVALSAQLRQARIRLTGLLGERLRYRQWQRAREIAAARAQERVRQMRAAAARRAAEQAAATGSAGGGGPSRWSGRWSGGSASIGQRVADAALRWLGTSYAWGGGNAAGPTYGVNGPGAGFRDGSIYGFDCSGLALWAWAQVGVALPHYSGYQYHAGRHVSVGELRAGDLVFWAYDTGNPSTIHHVAIYLGGGQVVQAPQSGDVVRVSPMWFDGYIGATRPG